MLGDRRAVFRSRRAIVKMRLVRLGGKALGAARAHLRYIMRDGVTRDGSPGGCIRPPRTRRTGGRSWNAATTIAISSA